MKVTVITITYRNSEGLQRTVASVRAQQGVNVDHIVVDGDAEEEPTATQLQDASRSAETIISREGYTMRRVQRPHRGVYDALNAGLEHARGDIIGILHAGDTFSDTDVLRQVVSSFENQTDTPDFIYGDVHFARPGGKVIRYYSGAKAGASSVLSGFAPPHPSLYISRRCAKTVGPYNADFLIAGDYEMFVRLFSKADFISRYLPVDMVEMMPGGVSASWHNRLFVNNRERLQALRLNGLPASSVRIARHYVNVFKGYLWKKK